MSYPNWCHMHGRKISISKLVLGKLRSLLLKSNAVILIISQEKDNLWSVFWEIIFAPNSKVEGNILFTAKELKIAFGLSDDENSKSGQWLIDRYGADVAEQGKYIRRGDFLNIPGPGTGNDGDPNVSIHLDNEIKNAIRDLLA